MTALMQNVADELLLDPPYRDALGDGNWLYDPGLLIRKARPTQDTDVVLFDPRLAVSGLKYRFLKAKGLEYGEEQRDFIARLNKIAGAQRAGARSQRRPGARAMRMMPTNQLDDQEPARHPDPQQAQVHQPCRAYERAVEGSFPSRPVERSRSAAGVDPDQFHRRAGSHHVASRLFPDGRDCRLARPISTLIPYYGANPKFVAAAGDGLYNASGTRIGTHSYGSDVWQWTSFANLSQVKFTVMVNGIDGIISWDGTTTTLPVMDARIRAGHPDDFTGFSEVDPNGFHISRTGCHGAAARFRCQETRQGAVAHQNRLWFANSTDLAVYYLPIQTMTGTMNVLPLNAYFKRGGTIRAITTWTLDRRRGHGQPCW